MDTQKLPSLGNSCIVFRNSCISFTNDDTYIESFDVQLLNNSGETIGVASINLCYKIRTTLERVNESLLGIYKYSHIDLETQLIDAALQQNRNTGINLYIQFVGLRLDDKRFLDTFITKIYERCCNLVQFENPPLTTFGFAIDEAHINTVCQYGHLVLNAPILKHLSLSAPHACVFAVTYYEDIALQFSPQDFLFLHDAAIDHTLSSASCEEEPLDMICEEIETLYLDYASRYLTD